MGGPAQGGSEDREEKKYQLTLNSLAKTIR